jgi:hypothetical protein
MCENSYVPDIYYTAWYNNVLMQMFESGVYFNRAAKNNVTTPSDYK